MKKFILIVTLSTLAFGAPAYKGNIEFKQKDGTTFQAKIKGDEWFNWIEDDKQHVIVYSNRSNNFEYGRLKELNGEIDLVPSGAKVGARLGTLAEDQSKIDKEILLHIWKQKREKALNYIPIQ
jgi:hypothetical protein